MQRIAELQREGLWSEKRLPKVAEPPRAKTHWDYLLEEMVWLAGDFSAERKWKKAAAKKVNLCCDVVLVIMELLLLFMILVCTNGSEVLPRQSCSSCQS